MLEIPDLHVTLQPVRWSLFSQSSTSSLVAKTYLLSCKNCKPQKIARVCAVGTSKKFSYCLVVHICVRRWIRFGVFVLERYKNLHEITGECDDVFPETPTIPDCKNCRLRKILLGSPLARNFSTPYTSYPMMKSRQNLEL